MSTYILGLDPGGTTGIALMGFYDDSFKLISTWQLGDPDFVVEKILSIVEESKQLAQEGDEFVLLCESFEVRPDVIHPDEAPKFIIKDLERVVEPKHPIRYQTASYAKGGVPPTKNGTRDRLHAFGVHQRGMRHANDAIRHCITYAIDKLQHKPTIVKGWGLPGAK